MSPLPARRAKMSSGIEILARSWGQKKQSEIRGEGNFTIYVGFVGFSGWMEKRRNPSWWEGEEGTYLGRKWKKLLVFKNLGVER